MAKRATGIEKGKASRSKKTTKRLAVKREMLAAKATKANKKPAKKVVKATPKKTS